MNQFSPNSSREDCIFSISNSAGLAVFLNKSEGYLEDLLKRPDNYRVFHIPKKDGGLREVAAPCSELKEIQRQLSEKLLDAWQPTPYSYGFLRGRNIVDNAREHLNQKWVLNIDLENFFPSITMGKIEQALVSPPCNMNPDAAGMIARIACNNGVLPQGSPSSPIISDIVVSSLDHLLHKYAQRFDCRYSRYADDITISTSQKLFPAEIAQIIKGNVKLGALIVNSIAEQGFKINETKVSLRSSSRHQEVTGIVVNEKANVRKQYVSQLRSILYNCHEEGVYPQALLYIKRYRHKIPNSITERIDDIPYVEHWFSMVLKGKTDFIRLVKGENSPTFLMIASRYNSVFGPVFNIPPKD